MIRSFAVTAGNSYSYTVGAGGGAAAAGDASAFNGLLLSATRTRVARARIMGRVAPAVWPTHPRVMSLTMVEVDQRDYRAVMVVAAAEFRAQALVAPDIPRATTTGAGAVTGGGPGGNGGGSANGSSPASGPGGGGGGGGANNTSIRTGGAGYAGQIRITIIPNSPPAPGTHDLVTTVNTPLKISASDLAAADYDANGDALTITAVSSSSTNGPDNNVSLAAGSITSPRQRVLSAQTSSPTPSVTVTAAAPRARPT